ncbi:hypothetical protein OAC45_02750 [Gammaproteobacteria bacterium]|jgi:hypothetical protein|nr:hypothetical protein [Gammaproteobacteria bacterium]|tara:strand:- start:756 stop:1151 length:396 start_codon:yes stop_codon:yes gene_type:complete
MQRLIKYSLVLVALYISVRVIVSLFFYDQFPIAFLATEFNQDQMDEYRARVLIPGFFLTLNYFIYRYFAGKNPTSPLWPIYVISVSLLITHIIGFITFMPFTKDPIIMFFIVLIICFVSRKGHNKRKNEIF